MFKRQPKLHVTGPHSIGACGRRYAPVFEGATDHCSEPGGSLDARLVSPRRRARGFEARPTEEATGSSPEGGLGAYWTTPPPLPPVPSSPPVPPSPPLPS